MKLATINLQRSTRTNFKLANTNLRRSTDNFKLASVNSQRLMDNSKLANINSQIFTQENQLFQETHQRPGPASARKDISLPMSTLNPWGTKGGGGGVENDPH